MGVDTDVPHKITRFLELFAAVRALVPSDAIHLKNDNKNIYHILILGEE
jgi:hypothetical protein